MTVKTEINHRENQRVEELWQKKYGVRTPDMCATNHVLQLGNHILCVNINGVIYVGTFMTVSHDYITFDEPIMTVVLVTMEHTYVAVFNNRKEVKSFIIVK